MDPFPEAWELISVFEGEPQLLDPRVPWAYNRVTFTLARPPNEIRCSIEPSNGILTFDWMTSGEPAVRLALRRVASLATFRESGREGIVATSSEPVADRVRIEISPRVNVVWDGSDG